MLRMTELLLAQLVPHDGRLLATHRKRCEAARAA